MTTGFQSVSVNARALVLVEKLRSACAELKVAVAHGELGETLIDAGAEPAGKYCGRIADRRDLHGRPRHRRTYCKQRDAALALDPGGAFVQSDHGLPRQPVCRLAAEQRGRQGCLFRARVGAGRALARKEKLFEELAYKDSADCATLVLESSGPPPPASCRWSRGTAGCHPDRLNFIYTPTQSFAGTVQIVARVLEVALHKAHELKFPLDRIVEGMGAAPLSPPHPDLVTAMGRTNDAIIYAGRAHLFVTGATGDARALAEQLPSTTSRDYGEPFAQIFKRFKGDFYAIDPMLFSPAQVTVTAIESGESFHNGRIDLKLLDASFA